MAAKDAEVYGKQVLGMFSWEVIADFQQIAVGLHSNRQIISKINGLDRTEQDQLDSNRYMAWLGGQVNNKS